MTTETNLISNSDLISTVAEATGQTKVNVKATVDALVEAIANGIVEGSTVRVAGLGQFVANDTAERTARNPSTGETITVPASKRVSFKVTKTLKDAVKATV